MPTRLCKLIGAGLAGAFITALPIAWASGNGAQKGHSGGPAGYGGGTQSGICTDCHIFRPGDGKVELLGAPQRYRAGVTYNLTVRISDSDPAQLGAGFQVSAEGTGFHRGALVVTNSATKPANGDSNYITHSASGYGDAVTQWITNGHQVEYDFAWEAPSTDEGPVTLFAAGNAGNNDNSIDLDHFYAEHVTMPFGQPGDADGDGDFDLFDFAMLQECFSGTGPATGAGCGFADFDPPDGTVDGQDAQAFLLLSLTGPTHVSRTSGLPPGYVVADKVRGGLLYDKWWVVNGEAAPFDPDTDPAGSHPLYLTSAGTQSGPSTFRCKECHGWDYKGSNGAYGIGSSHYTGIIGVNQTTLRPEELFRLLKADPDVTPNGHDMDRYRMSDADIWDVVKMTLEGVVDTDLYIIPITTPFFPGNPTVGEGFYDAYCAACHDRRSAPASSPRGIWLNFGTVADPVYLDDLTRSNPYEVLHKMRFGHPGAPMPSLELLGFNDPADLRNLGSFCADECLLRTDNCDVNAQCADIPAGFTCACNLGYVGDGVTCIPAP